MKVFGFILIIITIILEISAQEIDGIIIKGEDTLKAKLIIPEVLTPYQYSKLQERILYYDSLGVKHSIYPSDADEYSFVYNRKERRMLSRGDKFLYLEKDGNLKLFRYFYSVEGYQGHVIDGHYVGGKVSRTKMKYRLQKGNSFLVNYSKKDLKNGGLHSYFEDCPDLIKIVESRNIKPGNIKSIVDFYNSYCGN